MMAFAILAHEGRGRRLIHERAVTTPQT
jgi:hypothetical protein